MYRKHKCSKTKIIKMVGIVESSYYRSPSGGKKGKKASQHTIHKNKGLVSETEIVEAVKEILEHEFIDCGYRLMTSYLNREGYVINHKKTIQDNEERGLIEVR